MLLRARRFMTGVAQYRNHPARRGPEKAAVIWRSGTTSLLDYAPDAVHAPPVFIVPSLINRFFILDLEPEHSLIQFLVAQGFHPYVVDWDTPHEDEKHFGLGHYVTERLVPILDKISSGGAVHVVGYCMGGALTLALATLAPKNVRSLSLLAVPWDFHAGYRALGQDGASLEDKLRGWLSGNDYLPVEVVQSVFTAFQPLHAFRKFSQFASLDPGSFEATRFVLTEDWINDGVPLTIPAAHDCFGDWSSRNILARNQWRVDGKIVDPHDIHIPAYVVIPGRDRIVPPQSAKPLALALPRAVRHEPMMGHIGIMASNAAPHQVWTPLVGWLATH